MVRKIVDLSMGQYESVRKPYESVQKPYNSIKGCSNSNIHSRNTLFWLKSG